MSTQAAAGTPAIHDAGTENYFWLMPKGSTRLRKQGLVAEDIVGTRIRLVVLGKRFQRQSSREFARQKGLKKKWYRFMDCVQT